MLFLFGFSLLPLSEAVLRDQRLASVVCSSCSPRHRQVQSVLRLLGVKGGKGGAPALDSFDLW